MIAPDKAAYSVALAKLPPFAKGLARHAVTVAALRDAVLQELEMCREGNNPLSDAQVAALQLYLKRIA